jgi:hypothetical protein
MVADEIADRLNPAPAARGRPEQLPGNVGKLVGFAIAAAERINQSVVRQPFDRDLFGVERDRVWPSAILDDGVAANRQIARRRDETADTIAKCVKINLLRNCWRGLERRRESYILRMIMMRIEQTHH